MNSLPPPADGLPKLRYTTVMFRNLPRRFDQHLFLEELTLHVPRDSITFLHLPRDVRSSSNMGYAFVDFTDPEIVSGLVSHIAGKRWTLIPSTRHIKMIPAYVQGFEANLKLCATKACSSSTPLVFVQGMPVSFTSAIRMIEREDRRAEQDRPLEEPRPAVAVGRSSAASSSISAARKGGSSVTSATGSGAATPMREIAGRSGTSTHKKTASSSSGASAPHRTQASPAGALPAGACAHSASSSAGDSHMQGDGQRTTACGTVVVKGSLDSLFMAVECGTPSLSPEEATTLWSDDSDGTSGNGGGNEPGTSSGSNGNGSDGTKGTKTSSTTGNGSGSGGSDDTNGNGSDGTNGSNGPDDSDDTNGNGDGPGAGRTAERDRSVGRPSPDMVPMPLFGVAVTGRDRHRE